MGENSVLIAIVGAVGAIVGGAIAAVLQRVSNRESNDIDLLAQQGTQLAEAWKRIDSLTTELASRDQRTEHRIERLEATVRRQRALIKDLLTIIKQDLGREVDFTLYGLDPYVYDYGDDVVLLGDPKELRMEEAPKEAEDE